MRATALLVPTERHLAAELPRRGPGARGFTFRDFVSRAAARLAPELGPATPHTTRLLTREALARVSTERLRFPDEPAARVALSHAIDRAVGRLRRAGAGPAHLDAAETAPALLLADLMAHVDGRLAGARLFDARASAGLAASRLAAASSSHATLDDDLGGAVTVTGMAAWEPEDLSLLEALHARLRDAGGLGLTVELPALSGPVARAFDDAVSPVADVLERRWASLLDAPELSFRPSRSGAPAGILAARSADGEARAVAAQVLRALDRGTPPERIALVLPDLDEARLEPFRAALGDARVPFSEPRGRPVASCPEGRIALGLLAIAAGPVTRDQIIEILRAPGLHPGGWTERAGIHQAVGRAVLLAHRLREVPVEVDPGGRLFVDALTEATRARPDEGWMPRALDRMLKEARWVGADPAPRPGVRAEPASRREVARRLLTLVDKLELGRPPLAELGAALRAEGRGRPASKAETSPSIAGLSLRALGDSAAAVRALREAVRALVDGAAAAGLDGEPVSAGDFAAELGVAVAELGIGLGTSPTGAVRLARPADLAGLEHELVIVTGLSERAYGGAEGEVVLLDERLRQRLPSVCRPPSAREREAFRRAELCWAMAGTDRVILSHAAGDDDDLGAPHGLLRWAQDHGAEIQREPASRLARGASLPSPRSAELQALAAGAAPRGDVAERVAVERARLSFFLDPRAPAGPHTGRVTFADEAARLRLRAAVGGDTPARPVAVTAIERASGCAFAGFARRVLRVRRVDDLSESADHRERGTLVHRALHAAFEGQRSALQIGATHAEALAAARDAAERALGLSGAMAPLRKEAVLSAVADAAAVVESALASSDRLIFLAAEQSFGATPPGPAGAPPWEPLPLGGEDHEGAVIYVDGQIDRVDASADRSRARVVDYKTGRLPAADDHGRSAFQLPLYAAVVARTLGCDDVQALYVAIKPRGVVEEWPRGEDDRRALGGRRDEIAEAARKVILRMWSGEVAPRPAKATLCTRCEARDVCRRPAVAPIEEAEER